jgi:DNA-binding beta-propeller fold protein YncE
MQPRTYAALAAILVAGLFIATAPTASGGTPPGSTYHVITTYPIGGDGFWDYLNCDAKTHHLFISRGTHVMVVDANTGTVIGDIPDTEGVHGIALATDLDVGFTSNGGEDTVTEFDLKTFKEIQRIKVGQGPDSIIYDPATQRVFTFDGHSNDSTAIDATTGKVVGTIPLDGRPEFGATDGKGHVYCNIEDKSEIEAIDSNTLKSLHIWPLAPGESPSGLAIDARHRRLFSTCHNGNFVVMDCDTGKVIATPPIGDGPDAATFDPKLGLAFSSNGGGDGTLTIVHETDPNTFDVVANVPTQKGARTMALDTSTGRVYLVTAKFGPPAPGATGWMARRGTMLPGSFTIIVVGP